MQPLLQPSYLLKKIPVLCHFLLYSFHRAEFRECRVAAVGLLEAVQKEGMLSNSPRAHKATRSSYAAASKINASTQWKHGRRHICAIVF